MNQSRIETFWETVCSSQLVGYNVVTINIVIVLLLGYSFLYVEPGTGTYVISVITLGIALFNIVVVAGITAVCSRRKKEL